eukprot:11028290-Lingulodinium_polyedra.AAC.1
MDFLRVAARPYDLANVAPHAGTRAAGGADGATGPADRGPRHKQHQYPKRQSFPAQNRKPRAA